MSYLTQSHIATNPAMQARVAQAAASEGIDNPDYWMNSLSRTWAAAPGWDSAWESALVADPNQDPGSNEGVITDAMILSQVQLMNA